MKSLVKNYIDKLSLDKLKEFALKKNINLNDDEISFILDLVQKNYEDILINDDKYLNQIKEKIDKDEFTKIKDLYIYYKNKYKNYLF